MKITIFVSIVSASFFFLAGCSPLNNIKKTETTIYETKYEIESIIQEKASSDYSDTDFIVFSFENHPPTGGVNGYTTFTALIKNKMPNILTSNSLLVNNEMLDENIKECIKLGEIFYSDDNLIFFRGIANGSGAFENTEFVWGDGTVANPIFATDKEKTILVNKGFYPLPGDSFVSSPININATDFSIQDQKDTVLIQLSIEANGITDFDRLTFGSALELLDIKKNPISAATLGVDKLQYDEGTNTFICAVPEPLLNTFYESLHTIKFIKWFIGNNTDIVAPVSYNISINQ